MTDYAYQIKGETARFTASEMEVLALLHKADGRVVRHQALWDALYSLRPGDVPDMDVVKVFVSNIRRKLKQHRIDAVWGVGYKLTPTPRVRLHFRPVAA